jgi:hypothetical protein
MSAAIPGDHNNPTIPSARGIEKAAIFLGILMIFRRMPNISAGRGVRPIAEANVGLWSFLLGNRGAQPDLRFQDPTLGELRWSEDDESWIGDYGGYRIALVYSGQATPEPKLIEYARDFLGEDGAEFAGTFNAARIAHAYEFFRLQDEFLRLTVEMLYFSAGKDVMGCFVALEGADDPDRSWRAEFIGHECAGFGFDT